MSDAIGRLDSGVDDSEQENEQFAQLKRRRSARRRLSVRLPSLHSTLSHAEDFTTAPGAAVGGNNQGFSSPTVSSPGAHYMKMTDDGEWTFSYTNPDEPNQYTRERQPDKQNGILYQLIRFPMLVSVSLRYSTFKPPNAQT